MKHFSRLIELFQQRHKNFIEFIMMVADSSAWDSIIIETPVPRINFQIATLTERINIHIGIHVKPTTNSPFRVNSGHHHGMLGD